MSIQVEVAMQTLERTIPTAGGQSDVAPRPRLDRRGIRWSGGAAGRKLEIRLDFENPTAEPTAIAWADVAIAPLGAFVPTRPLTRILVPPVPPYRRRTVTALVEPEDAGDGTAPSDLRRVHRLFRGTPRTEPVVSDPGPPMWRTGRQRLGLPLWRRAEATEENVSQQCHFIGNLNVFVSGADPVERHVAPICLDRKRQNIAAFVVGDGTRDVYTFSFEAQTPGWHAFLPSALLDDSPGQGVAWDVPIEFGFGSVMLVLIAPNNVESDRVMVWVTRASTQQRVPIEFELGAPDAAACYHF
jgi:hypothetical protein